jgi:hypothetical protein
MAFFGALGRAATAPFRGANKVMGKVPGMGAVNRAASAVPGTGFLGNRPPQPMNLSKVGMQTPNDVIQAPDDNQGPQEPMTGIGPSAAVSPVPDTGATPDFQQPQPMNQGAQGPSIPDQFNQNQNMRPQVMPRFGNPRFGGGRNRTGGGMM